MPTPNPKTRRASFRQIDPEVGVLTVPNGALFLFGGKLAESIEATCKEQAITPDELMRRMCARLKKPVRSEADPLLKGFKAGIKAV